MRLRREFVLLDLLRFLAALCVLAFHFEIFALKDAAGAQRHLNGFDAAVDFFFILSGFVIAHSSADRVGSLRGYGQFLIRRLARIYPLHLLTLGLAIALALAATALRIRLGAPERYAFDSIPANLLLLQAWGFSDRLSFNIVSWSISAEWFLYLTFPLWFWLARALKLRFSLALLVLWFVVIRFLEHRFGLVPWNDRTYQFAMIRAVPAFFLGIALWLTWKDRLSDRECPASITYALSAGVLVLMWFRVPGEILIVAFAAVILAGAMAPASADSPMSRLLGNASYGLYMWHHLIGTIIFALLAPRSTTITVATIAIATAVSIIASILSFRLFESPAKNAVLKAFAPPSPKGNGTETLTQSDPVLRARITTATSAERHRDRNRL